MNDHPLVFVVAPEKVFVSMPPLLKTTPNVFDFGGIWSLARGILFFIFFFEIKREDLK